LVVELLSMPHVVTHQLAVAELFTVTGHSRDALADVLVLTQAPKSDPPVPVLPSCTVQAAPGVAWADARLAWWMLTVNMTAKTNSASRCDMVLIAISLALGWRVNG
jgi:hypothetical protein